ncbi:MAG: hypothetical protein ABC596_09520 [Candidatus Methanosuratincola petrocarbonis]|nr:hypothetical protein [Synergistales bacterium]
MCGGSSICSSGVEGAVGKKGGALRAAVVGWERLEGRRFPWREGRTPYRVLVSELLLKRTTSTAAVRVFGEFVGRYPDIWSLAAADRGGLEAIFSKIGLQRQRAHAALAMARHIREVHGGRVPDDYRALLRVPGVGDYTASAVLSFGYGIPVATVDSNVVRVLGRVFRQSLGSRATLGNVRKIAQSIVPREGHELYNYGMIDLGALVCRYGRPRCARCPVTHLCELTTG